MMHFNILTTAKKAHILNTLNFLTRLRKPVSKMMTDILFKH